MVPVRSTFPVLNLIVSLFHRQAHMLLLRQHTGQRFLHRLLQQVTVQDTDTRHIKLLAVNTAHTYGTITSRTETQVIEV